MLNISPEGIVNEEDGVNWSSGTTEFTDVNNSGLLVGLLLARVFLENVYALGPTILHSAWSPILTKGLSSY